MHLEGGAEVIRMKLFFVRAGWVVAVGATGCAAGSVTTLEELTPEVETVEPVGGARAADVDASSVVDAARDQGVDVNSVVPAPDAGVPVGACAFATAGSLVSFDLSALVGTPAKASPSSSAAGLIVTPLTRTGVTAASASGAINASAWPIGGLDTGKHYAFTVTPPVGCTLTLTTLAADVKASSNGPATAAIATSVDNYVAVRSSPLTSAAGAIAFPVPGVVAVQAKVELHVYGFAAGSPGGTMRLQNAMTLSGSLN